MIEPRYKIKTAPTWRPVTLQALKRNLHMDDSVDETTTAAPTTTEAPTTAAPTTTAGLTTTAGPTTTAAPTTTAEPVYDTDTHLLEILDAVIEGVQNYTGRQIARATLIGYMDGFPENEFVINRGPVNEIVNVKYYDSSNVLQTMASSDYIVDNVDLTARMKFIKTYGVYADRFNQVQIEFTAGWADAASVPKDLKDAIILEATDRYLHPENKDLNFGMGLRVNASVLKLRDYKIQRY